MSLKFFSSGSAKDLYVIDGEPDFVAFKFSERISVFDYGAIPDLIAHRSSALRRCAQAFEKIFQNNSITTLYDASLSEKYGEFVQKRVLHPKHVSAVDSDSESSWHFIPLEIIFRWGAPVGSSYLKRNPSVAAFSHFANPVVEFSTKLEPQDRILDEKEAIEICQKSLEAKFSFAALKEVARHVAEVLKVSLNEIGLELWDGKIECAYNKESGEIALVDAMTPDELRVSLSGLQAVPLSKELLRQWLGSSSWGYQVQVAKKTYGDLWRDQPSGNHWRDQPSGNHWRDCCPPPPALSEWRVKKLSDLYLAFAECLEKKTSASLMNWIRQEPLKPQVFLSGSGGREAAIRWRLENEGCDIVEDSALADAVFLTQDADLAQGMADEFVDRRIWTIGASRLASEIEWSKKYGREIATKAEIPIPRYTLNVDELESFLSPPVVKFDGLAAGKGVVVAENLNEAREAIARWSGKGEVLLEERLVGPEASAFFAIQTGVSGVECVYLGSAKDFKRRYAGDSGPNTGGMGAHSPSYLQKPEDLSLWKSWAIATAEVLKKEGRPYNGILYLGLIKDIKRGWCLIEYNARPGDPETQALVCLWPTGAPVLRSLLGLSVFVAKDFDNESENKKSVVLSLVHPQYPEPVTNDLTLPEWKFPEQDDLKLFMAGSRRGRMAYLVGVASSYQEAGDKIFAQLVESPWKDLIEWRPDILE